VDGKAGRDGKDGRDLRDGFWRTALIGGACVSGVLFWVMVLIAVIGDA